MSDKIEFCCANCGTTSNYFLSTSCPSCGYIGSKWPKIDLNGYEDMLLFLQKETYELNYTIALTIHSLDDSCLEPFLEITTNFAGAEYHLNENEIMVKTWSENSSIIKPLLESGFFIDTGKKVKVSQFCEASIWKLIRNF